jgi:hypothetical protein
VRNAIYKLATNSHIKPGSSAELQDFRFPEFSEAAMSDQIMDESLFQRSKWTFRIYVSSGAFGNSYHIQHLLRDVANIEYVSLPDDESVSDDGGYNRFLKSPDFWNDLRLRFDRVLVFQVDSLILHRNIAPFLKYDYVGAPWHMTPRTESATWLARMQKYGYLKVGVGNGGFSLRNPEAMYSIAKAFTKKSGSLNEDVFFSVYSEKSKDMKLRFPRRADAYRFAIETPCDDIERALNMSSASSFADRRTSNKKFLIPFGVHNAWSYMKPENAKYLLKYSLL